MIKMQNNISKSGTVRTFLRVGSCSETLCNVLNRSYDRPMYHEEHAALTFAGGIAQYGYQCGVLWGAALAAGTHAYHTRGGGAKAELAAVYSCRNLSNAFELENGDLNCMKLIDTDWNKPAQVVRYFFRGGPFRCLGMAARFAPIARDILDKPTDVETEAASISTPASCSALTARQLGASEMHAIMASGFAGGIGLCGGGCGALGTAIWLATLAQSRETDGRLEIKLPKALKIASDFLALTDGKMECESIVGSTFTTVKEHSEYLESGGCRKILELLAQTEM